MRPIATPLQQFFDLDGSSLQGGYLYFGTANQNPETNPITVYWDSAGTQPALQPLRTSNGYIVRAGKAANVYVNSAYSVTIRNSKRELVDTLPDSSAYSVLDLLASSTGASLVGYTPSGTGAESTTVEKKLQQYPSVFDKFTDAERTDVLTGALTIDLQPKLQACLDSGIPHFMPPIGKYRIDSELQGKDGSGFFSNSAAFFFQNVGNEPTLGTCAEIVYKGAGGANSCMLRASKVAVGTKPTYQTDESETLRNFICSGIYFNGNDLAEYGLYAARAGLGNVFENNVATGCKKHGVWMGEMWSCTIKNILGIYNYGCGVTMGLDTFSWGANTINACQVDTIECYNNGRDLSSWTTADYLSGYGFGWGGGKGNTLRNIIAEENNGVGIVWAPASGPNELDGWYSEDNCKAAASTSDRWALWFQSNSGSVLSSIKNFYVLYNGASGLTNAPRIKLTGTAVTNWQECPVFDGSLGGAVFDADFGMYKISRTALQSTSRIVSHYPQYSDPDSISSSQTTLYVGLTATGTGSGIDSSNLMAGLAAAMRVAKVVSSITTIDYSAVTTTPSAALTVDGTGFSRRLTISGGTTGRFNAVSGTSVTFTGFQRELTIDGFAVVERSYYKDGRYVLNNCPVLRMDTGSTAGAAVNADNCNLQISGTSVISVSGSSAATKIGISVAGGSNVSFSNAVAGTITGYSAANAINFDDGGGIVTIANTTATSVWGAAAQITRNSGGGGGMILATNGLNP